MPVMRDLKLLYAAARGKDVPSLSPVGVPFEVLQQRLYDTLHLRPSPVRSSFRGCLFEHSSRGYSHDIQLEPQAVACVAQAAARYRMPLDVVLFGLLVCAMARADGADMLEFTLFTPNRDGPGEAMMLGFFSDWRDLSVNVDFKLATVLGTISQISRKIIQREWVVHNALQKPERTVVNLQTLDLEQHMQIQPLGESFWGGDSLDKPRKKRRDDLSWVRYPAQFTLFQQDESSWWVSMSVSHEIRPTSWMRCFVWSFREAMRALCLDQIALVHGLAVPEDWVLLDDWHRQESRSGIDVR